MSDKYYRDTLLDVNLEAIAHNYREIQRLNDNKTFIAVVKADGYGLGAKVISEYLSAAGVTFFAVATLDEAMDLRMHGIKEKILVLGTINPEDINKAIQHRIAVTAPNLTWVKSAKEHVTDQYDKEVWIHIKVNTGMNRYGTDDPAEIKAMIEEIHSSEQFVYEGIFSHFTSSDIDSDATEIEFKTFQQILKTVELPEYVHISNSGGSLTLKEDFTTAVRAGIALYGYYPSEHVEKNTAAVLKPSVTLSSKIVGLHHLNPKESVSYGKKYTAKTRETIATLPIGYADGLLRRHNGYHVKLEDGTQCKITGTICMDATMISVPAGTELGETVTFIEAARESSQSLERYSEFVETISYESLCAFGRRIPRRYKGKSTEFIYNAVIN